MIALPLSSPPDIGHHSAALPPPALPLPPPLSRPLLSAASVPSDSVGSLRAAQSLYVRPLYVNGRTQRSPPTLKRMGPASGHCTGSRCGHFRAPAHHTEQRIMGERSAGARRERGDVPTAAVYKIVRGRTEKLLAGPWSEARASVASARRRRGRQRCRSRH